MSVGRNASTATKSDRMCRRVRKPCAAASRTLQAPLQQVWPAGHFVPQPPQLLASERESEQVPSLGFGPVGFQQQGTLGLPDVQEGPVTHEPHRSPQPPDGSSSKARSTR